MEENSHKGLSSYLAWAEGLVGRYGGLGGVAAIAMTTNSGKPEDSVQSVSFSLSTKDTELLPALPSHANSQCRVSPALSGRVSSQFIANAYYFQKRSCCVGMFDVKFSPIT